MSTLPERRWASTARSRVGHRLGQRLLDEAVLARLRGRGWRARRGVGHRRWRARPHRARGRRAGRRASAVKRASAELARIAVAHLGLRVAAPAQLASTAGVEVAGEVRAPVAEADHADATAGRRSQAAPVPAARAAGDAAQVDDERRALGDRVVVDAGVRGHDERQVGALERLVEAAALCSSASGRAGTCGSW